MMFATLPWQLPSDLPWQVLTSPVEQWDRLPSFLVGEYLFIALAGLALWHAWRNGRSHVFVWVAAIIAGTANDVIFMALPLVDNFWQAQATIMLTPRLPLYIPCVYVCFMYLPTVAVWRLGLNRWSGAALTGLAAIVFYAPYDIIGAKFLWWTWHDTDAPIAARLLGAPIGSTVWVITFAATFAWLIRWTVDKDPGVSNRSFGLGLLKVGLLSSVVMVLQMTVLQQLDGGVPGPIMLIVVVILYLGLAVWGATRERNPRPWVHDRVLATAIAVYFVALLAIGASFTPELHRNTSLHQTYGACHVEATDITGATRFKFVCAEDYEEDYTFGCVGALPAEGAEWYTVCGRPYTSKAAWLGGVGGLGAVGIALFGFLLGQRRQVPPAS
jgi:hypothetical protein